MSWSCNFKGKPDKVIAAIQEDVKRYGENNQSRAEYDAALPHIVELIQQNVAAPGKDIIVEVEASGSGSIADGKVISSSCNVNIRQIWGVLLSLAIAFLLPTVSLAQERTDTQRLAAVERAMPAVMSILTKHTDDISNLKDQQAAMQAQLDALLKANGMQARTTQGWDGATTTWSQSSAWQSSDAASSGSPRTPVRTIFRRVFQRGACGAGG